MSSGPSTLGIMITSRASPTSVTAVVRSSRPHGESRELTRAHSWVSGVLHFLPTSTRPARAASLSAAGTPSSRLASSTSTVGAMSGTLPTIFGLEAGTKWIIRDGRKGISRTGSGAPTASGRKKSFGERMGPPDGEPTRPPYGHPTDAGGHAPHAGGGAAGPPPPTPPRLEGHGCAPAPVRPGATQPGRGRPAGAGR